MIGTPVRRRRLAVLARGVTLFLLAASVNTCRGNSAFALRSSSRFIILPRLLVVEAPTTATATTFHVEVTARSAAGDPAPLPPLTWVSVPAGLTFSLTATGADITIPAGTLPPPDASGYRISAANGAEVDEVPIVVLRTPSAGGDAVRSLVVSGADPDVLLASGMLSGACTADLAFAFIGAAPIGDWTASAPCQRAASAVFSVNGPPHIAAASWSAGQDVVDATQPVLAATVPLRVIIGVPLASQDSATSLFDGSELFAEGVFYRMRTGVRFIVDPPVHQELPGSFQGCADVPSLPANARPDASRLNVYIIDRVEWIEKGYFCAPNVVLVSNLFGLSSTLAHELSHALGLIAQDSGHVDRVYGFDVDNVMFPSPGLFNGYDSRRRLSLGQVYRMHVDGRSWLKRGSGLEEGPMRCPCNPYSADTCPILSVDIRPVTGLPTTPFPCTGP